MKKLHKLVFVFILGVSLAGFSQQGMGTNTPDKSAVLELKSSNKGFLLPRMTEVQRDAIVSPAEGLLVFCTDCNSKGLYVYDGSSWGLLKILPPPPPQTVTISSGAGTFLTFLAHNLGANYSLDPDIPLKGIHGNYYQWGIKSAVADADTPPAAIVSWTTPTTADTDWLDENEGSKTNKDPCPSGFRVPSNEQWEAVLGDSNNVIARIGSWLSSSTNYGSALKIGALTLPVAGYRYRSDGALRNRGYHGKYWSSTVLGTSAYRLYFSSSSANTTDNIRTNGFSVRCVSE